MYFKTFILILITSTYLFSQDYEKDLQNNRVRLSDIQSEISSLKNQLIAAKEKALSVTDQIKLIDREMSLIARAKGLLLTEQHILERRLENNSIKLSDTRIKLKKLKVLYEDRLRYMYKYGKVKNLELLLTSNSFNQAFVRYKYLKLIADYDEKTIHEIAENQQKIEQLQKKLTEDIDAKDRSLQNKKTEEGKYISRRKEKNGLLSQINRNQNYFKSQISVKQQEQAKLTSLITTLEKTRKAQAGKGSTKEFVTIDFDNFNKGKGKLPWPVHGKIISTFGKQYDPVTKTSINNSGIEIQANIGSPVKNVFVGVVRMITYLGGYGNTVIIDHGKSFYTVYSHLGEIYVGKNDVVDTNQIIAQVGESGSLAGSKLHFEIYGGNKANNPQSWLRN